MFDAEYIDVKLTKVRKFPGIGESDTLRVFEPPASFSSRAYKDGEARHNGIINEMKKNTVVLLFNNDTPTPLELDKKVNILDYISVKDGDLLQKAFADFFPRVEGDGEQDPK